MMTFSASISALPKLKDSGILHFLALNLHQQKPLGGLDLEGPRGMWVGCKGEDRDLTTLVVRRHWSRKRDSIGRFKRRSQDKKGLGTGREDTREGRPRKPLILCWNEMGVRRSSRRSWGGPGRTKLRP